MTTVWLVVGVYLLFLAAFLVTGWRVRSWRDAHPSPWVEPSWADERWWER